MRPHAETGHALGCPRLELVEHAEEVLAEVGYDAAAR
jgi:hypothetical protein